MKTKHREAGGEGQQKAEEVEGAKEGSDGVKARGT